MARNAVRASLNSYFIVKSRCGQFLLVSWASLSSMRCGLLSLLPLYNAALAARLRWTCQPRSCPWLSTPLDVIPGSHISGVLAHRYSRLDRYLTDGPIQLSLQRMDRPVYFYGTTDIILLSMKRCNHRKRLIIDCVRRNTLLSFEYSIIFTDSATFYRLSRNGVL